MADPHLEPGRKRVFGKEVVFNLSLSGAQVGSTRYLESLDDIILYFREHDVRSVLDFGAGRLRNTRRLELEPWLATSFSEFAALQSHALDREQLRNDKALAARLRSPPGLVSEHIRDCLDRRTRSLIDRLAGGTAPSAILKGLMVVDLNQMMWQDSNLASVTRKAGKVLPPEVDQLERRRPVPQSSALLRINRYLLETVYPTWVSDSPRNQVYPDEYRDGPRFDSVLLSYVLHTLPHPENRADTLTTCHRLLEPGGILVVASPNYNSPIHQSLDEGGGDLYDIDDPQGFGGWVRGLDKTHQTFYSEPKRDVLIALVESFDFELLDPHPTWKQRTAKVLGFRKPGKLPRRA